MTDHETSTHTTPAWVLDATDGYCPECLVEKIATLTQRLAAVEESWALARDGEERWMGRALTLQADLQRVRGALEQIANVPCGDKYCNAGELATAALTGHAPGRGRHE
jgi:hypothetical protein